MERLLSQESICALFEITPRTALRWTNEGILPRPLMFGPRVMRWRQSDIEALIKKAANDAKSNADQYGTRNGESGDGDGMGFPA